MLHTQNLPLPQLPMPETALRLAGSIAGRHRTGCVERGELTAEALLGLCESQRRHDAERGSLTTYAFARMHGRALDALRRESRLHRAREALRAWEEVAPVGPTISTRLDVGRAVDAVQADLSSAERVVLQGVYAGDRSMRELASSEERWSEDQLHRAHQRLLARLRAKLSPAAVR
jgi:RNA polymerase sigma factor (sigma-70 family)